MADLDDYQFQATEPGDGRPRDARRSVMPMAIVAAVVLVAIAIGAYFLWQRPAEPSPAQTTAAPAPAPAPDTAPTQVASEAQPYDLPPLDDSDAFMRARAAELSTSAVVAAWSRGSGLVTNLAVVLENTSRGLNPAQHLRALRPSGTFRVLQRGNRIVLDPRNYQRFTPIAQTATSIDPTAAARVYGGIKPLLQMAYGELGIQEPIDRVLERAVRQLLSAPVVEGDVLLETGGVGVGYRFASPALESLSAAQKQLIRMGPANQRAVQSRVRQFAEAAGIAVDGPAPAGR